MKTESRNKVIAAWMLLVCLVLVAMVVLGGVTRLTGSGLSMVQWEPVTGVLPPSNDREWQQVFDLYKATPEYQKINSHFDLENFKSIFWFEFAHRVLGRAIGALFFLPMLFFIVKGWVNRSLAKHLLTMFVLGGLQGLLGWYMVKSGLVDNPHVSQYRLVAHLGFAVLIFSYIFLTAMGLLFPHANTSVPGARSGFRWAVAASILVYITILAGGFVAGLKAGFAYNTFPLMAGEWIPHNYGAMTPFWHNWFENIAAVQFDHRLLATLILLLIGFVWWRLGRQSYSRGVQTGRYLMLALVLLQYTLGVLTLIYVVPVPLAAWHQGNAILLLASALFLTQQLYRLR